MYMPTTSVTAPGDVEVGGSALRNIHVALLIIVPAGAEASI